MWKCWALARFPNVSTIINPYFLSRVLWDISCWILQTMNEELYECDWCGVLMDKPVCSSLRPPKLYCSYDCCKAGDLPNLILISLFGFSTVIISLLVSNGRRLILLMVGVSLGLLFSYCSFDAYKFRKKVPRGSRKGFRLEDGVNEWTIYEKAWNVRHTWCNLLSCSIFLSATSVSFDSILYTFPIFHESTRTRYPDSIYLVSLGFIGWASNVLCGCNYCWKNDY